SSVRALSAAERPSAILRARSSSAAVIGGHTYFIVNQTRIRNTIIWMIRVAVMLTLLPRVPVARKTAGRSSVKTRAGPRTASLSVGDLRQLAQERVGRREPQGDTDADDERSVDQADQQEHLRLQFTHQFGLAGSRLEVLAAHDADADT